MAKHRRDTGYTRKSADPLGTRMLKDLPYTVDAVDWMTADPGGYFTFGRMLAGRTAHWQVTGERANTHRAETPAEPGPERTTGTRFARKGQRNAPDVLMDEILQGQGARA